MRKIGKFHRVFESVDITHRETTTRGMREDGWREIYVKCPSGAEYKCQLRVFDEPSRFGIDKGRVSKLWVSKNGETVLNYDRGWDVRPTTGEVEDVLDYILDLYN